MRQRFGVDPGIVDSWASKVAMVSLENRPLGKVALLSTLV